MRILITGAAGFIGFYVVQRLLKEENIEVVGLDNLNDYYDVGLKLARLKACGIDPSQMEAKKNITGTLFPHYTFRQTDITDSQDIEQLFAEGKFDYVIHLAAQTGVRYSIENPMLYVQSNMVGFANILEACRHHHIKHLIYASSSSVYGMHNKIPYSETDNVDYPVSLYAATKKSNELMAHAYSHLYQLPATGLRFFTVYGPWGRPDMAPMLFAEAIFAGKPIKLFNGGDMLRDFTFVEDIAEGVFRTITVIPDSAGEHPYYRLFNIGNSAAVDLSAFVSEMERACDRQAIVELYPMQPGDVKETYADTTSLQAQTGYKPSTPLGEGVRRFIDWYKAYYW